MLCKPKAYGRWVKCITTIEQYDMLISPAKLIKGQGLTKIMVESNLKVVRINVIQGTKENEPEKEEEVFVMVLISSL